MPTLEMINERFGRLLRTSIYNLLRRAPAISVGSVQILKFAEYVRILHLPTSLNLSSRPLANPCGTALTSALVPTMSTFQRALSM
jgi:flagellar motor switch protein FliM